MRLPILGISIGTVLTCGGFAQVIVPRGNPVVPGSPGAYVTRPTGPGMSGGVEVIPVDGSDGKKARYITHIVLSDSRFWNSNDGKTLEGKLIAFEDMVAEAPQGAAQPAVPAPPSNPTLIRDGKVRLLVAKKIYDVPLARLVDGDQDFIRQLQAALEKKGAQAAFALTGGIVHVCRA